MCFVLLAAVMGVPADAGPLRHAMLLFIITAVGLAALFVGVLILTRSRRLRRQSSLEQSSAPQQPLVDPWRESGQRMRSGSASEEDPNRQ
jgi:hypothetical protein